MINMKKIILITAICFTSHICPAQLTTNLAVMPQPSGSIYNWGTKEVTYIISNQAGSVVRNAVIKATLKTTDGTVVGTTNLAKAKVRAIGPGTLILYAADVIPLEVMVFNGKHKTSLERSGKLPADNYQLCLQLVTAVDFLPVSEERCRIFTLAAFQLPIPVMPANEIALDAKLAQTAITFRWTPISPRPAFPITYRIMVFEMLDKQQPVQAMRSNQPLLVKNVIGTTQYIWQPQLGMIDCCPDMEPDMDSLKAKKAGISSSRSNLRSTQPGSSDEKKTGKKFVWVVQALDDRGLPFGDGNVNGDGISEPAVFIIGKIFVFGEHYENKY